VDLPRKERRLILILFASTIFMAPFVAVHAAYMYGFDDKVEATVLLVTAHTEVSSFFCDLVQVKVGLIHYLGSSFGHNM
jgi:ABC-type lipoprotein release transport system permease subunit